MFAGYTLRLICGSHRYASLALLLFFPYMIWVLLLLLKKISLNFVFGLICAISVFVFFMVFHKSKNFVPSISEFENFFSFPNYLLKNKEQ